MFIIFYLFYKILHKIIFKLFPEEWSIKLISLNTNNNFILKHNNYEYFADPFVFQFKDKIILVFETFDKRLKIGRISMYVLNNKLEVLDYFDSILNLSKHSSYPFILNLENNFFMIPETSKNKTLSVWKFDNYSFQFLQDILIDVEFVDTNVYKVNNYLLFTTTDLSNNNRNMYFTTDLNFNIIQKPTYSDFNISRNAGIDYQNIINKISQNRTINYYGTNIYVSKIDFHSNVFINSSNEEYSNYLINHYGVHHFVKFNDLVTFDYKI